MASAAPGCTSSALKLPSCSASRATQRTCTRLPGCQIAVRPRAAPPRARPRCAPCSDVITVAMASPSPYGRASSTMAGASQSMTAPASRFRAAGRAGFRLQPVEPVRHHAKHGGEATKHCGEAAQHDAQQPAEIGPMFGCQRSSRQSSRRSNASKRRSIVSNRRSSRSRLRRWFERYVPRRRPGSPYPQDTGRYRGLKRIGHRSLQTAASNRDR